MEALFIFYAADEGHTHLFVDLTPVTCDGASEEEALEWAYEKHGQGRTIHNVDTGTREYLTERLNTAFHYAKD
ncbi:hypothetical protein [Paraburkholderia sp. GAS32]|uniref:hypothetical protein n=1 Tax=Paraburkholderia sp. GAS32 TaxID=3035129 RepID=UPI003D1D8493